MRCSCVVCGTYMVQSEKGLESGCVCPECFNKCSACMGVGAKPLKKEDIALFFTDTEEKENNPH